MTTGWIFWKEGNQTMNKIKFNFNYKSKAAWATLATAVITGVLGILTAVGVTVPADLGSQITGTVTAILGLLGTLGF